MSDIVLRKEGRAGRITLNRPDALNALTYEMCLEIERQVDAWAEDDGVALVVIDGAPGRAFCSGGDIAALYEAGQRGDLGYGRRFWRDEYRLNAKLATYAKPLVTFLHGFTMGGGVGIGCHARHRVVGETSRIAMPECGIGLVPDVGGSCLLARAPGRLGDFLGLTGERMGPADALHAGFADLFVPEARWPALIGALVAEGDPLALQDAAASAGEAPLARDAALIDDLFSTGTLSEIAAASEAREEAPAQRLAKALRTNAPLSLSCAFEILRNVRQDPTIETALGWEYRFTSRAMEHGDIMEGVRALIVDKDRAPRWRHGSLAEVGAGDIAFMLAPVSEDMGEKGALA